jgi:tRNA modification GTPase
MHTGDVIIASASAAGRGARGIIRLSGDQTIDAARATVRCDAWTRGVRRGFMALGRPGGTELAVLVSVFTGPRSYTGESIVEIQLPGNPVLETATAAIR